MKKLLTAIVVTVMLAGMAAVAQAIPVKLLPEPTAADVACGNCVNEGTLLKELQAWQKQYNALLRSLEKKPEKELYSVMADTIGTNPISIKGVHGDGLGLEAVTQPALTRWGDGTPTPQDKKLFSNLERYGITPDSVDGVPYLSAELKLFRSRFTVPPTAKDFVTLLNSQPNQYTYNEGHKLYTDEELSKWLMQWDLLMQNAGTQPWREAAQTRYLFLLDMLLFYKSPDEQESESSVSRWRQTLQQCITAHPDTLTATLFKVALDDTNDKSYTLTNNARKKILDLAKDGATAGNAGGDAAAQANTVDSLKDISAVVYRDGVAPLTEKEYSSYLEKSPELQKADKTLNSMWKQAKKSKPTQQDLREQRFWLMMRGNEMQLRLKYGYAKDRLEALIQTVQRRCCDFEAEIYYADLSEEDIKSGNIKSEESFHDDDCKYGETLEYFFYTRMISSLNKPHPDDSIIKNCGNLEQCAEKLMDHLYKKGSIPRSITEGIYIGARDHQKALQWFEQAMQHGNRMAKIFLLALYKEKYEDKDEKIQQILNEK